MVVRFQPHDVEIVRYVLTELGIIERMHRIQGGAVRLPQHKRVVVRVDDAVPDRHVGEQTTGVMTQLRAARTSAVLGVIERRAADESNLFQGVWIDSRRRGDGHFVRLRPARRERRLLEVDDASYFVFAHPRLGLQQSTQPRVRLRDFRRVLRALLAVAHDVNRERQLWRAPQRRQRRRARVHARS